MLKIIPENKGGNRVRPGQRLYLTRDKSRLVGEGDPEGATLYCSEYAEVPREDFERLMPPAPKVEPEPEPEPQPEPEVKAPPKPKKRATRKARSKKGA